MTTLPATKERVVSDYTDLMRTVRDEGLLGRTIPFYVKVFLLVTAVGVGSWFSVFLFAGSWWVLIPAAVLGVVAAQYGFLAHEASHRQIFTSNKINDRVGLVLADLFVGLGYGWWMHKHNKHHANPNKIGKDPDIEIKVLSFTPESLASKKGVEKFISKRQGILFPFLLLLTGFDLLFESFKALVNPKVKVQHRFVELVFLSIRVAAPVIIAFTTMNPLLASLFIIVNMCVFGLFMGGAFAPNHKGMPTIPHDLKVDFLRRQVLTSRNIKPSTVMDFFMGGLNYQIEHHLFPSMPRPHLRRAQQITQEYCRKKAISYTQVNMFQAYASVMKHLNNVGLSRESVDPFDCPMKKFRYTT